MNKAELIEAIEAYGIEGINELTNTEMEKLLGKLDTDRDEISSLKAVISSLNKKVVKPDSKTQFKVGKKTYELIALKSNYKGKIVTAEALKGNKVLLEELIKIRAAILKEV
jgi:hypothetical protein